MDHLSSQELYKNYRLCAEHFEDDQFMNKEAKNKLIHSAVPTIFKGVPNPPLSITPKRKLNKRFAESQGSPPKEPPQKKHKGMHNLMKV